MKNNKTVVFSDEEKAIMHEAAPRAVADTTGDHFWAGVYAELRRKKKYQEPGVEPRRVRESM